MGQAQTTSQLLLQTCSRRWSEYGVIKVKNCYWPEQRNKASRSLSTEEVPFCHLADHTSLCRWRHCGRPQGVLNRGVLAAPCERRPDCYCKECVYIGVRPPKLYTMVCLETICECFTAHRFVRFVLDFLSFVLHRKKYFVKFTLKYLTTRFRHKLHKPNVWCGGCICGSEYVTVEIV
jgi:hypothetical protein